MGAKESGRRRSRIYVALSVKGTEASQTCLEICGIEFGSN
jgi:hypothetical protein